MHGEKSDRTYEQDAHFIACKLKKKIKNCISIIKWRGFRHLFSYVETCV